MKTPPPSLLLQHIIERTEQLLEYYYQKKTLSECRQDILENLENEYMIDEHIDAISEHITEFIMDTVHLDDWDEETIEEAKARGRIKWVDESFYAEPGNRATYVQDGHYEYI